MGRETAGSLLVVMKLPNEVDVANCATIEVCLLAVASAPGLVIADLTGTVFCDCAGIEMLVHVDDHARASGSTLRVAVTPGTSVARVMAVLGADRALSVCKSVADARPASRAATAADGPSPH
jgi:anti-sigma B factor antagonist